MKIAAKSEAFEGCEKLSSIIWKTKKLQTESHLLTPEIIMYLIHKNSAKTNKTKPKFPLILVSQPGFPEHNKNKFI